MTTEEKQLLLKDLCARLPYRTKVHIIGEGGTEIDADLTTFTIDYFESWTVQPYLRPMSSITEDEEKEHENCFQSDDTTAATLLVDFYNKHHFDYRGLIEKGLALEASKDMY